VADSHRLPDTLLVNSYGRWAIFDPECVTVARRQEKNLSCSDLHAGRSFERKRQASHHKHDVIGYRCNALVQFTEQIAVSPTQLECGNYSTSNLVRHKNDRAGWGFQGGAQCGDAFGYGTWIVAKDIEQFPCKKRETVDQKQVTVTDRSDRGSQLERFLNRRPVLRSLSTVSVDFAMHLFVFAPLSRREKRDTLRIRSELERITALTATYATQDKSHFPRRICMHATLSGVRQAKRSKTKRDVILRQLPRDPKYESRVHALQLSHRS
jgi:hypothetical protein